MEADKAKKDFRLPSINGGEIVLQDDQKISRHASFVHMKSEFATVPPENMSFIYNIKDGEIEPMQDGLSQLSVAKSFGRRFRDQ